MYKPRTRRFTRRPIRRRATRVSRKPRRAAVAARKFQRPYAMINRTSNFIPNRYITKMIYADSLDLDNTSGGTTLASAIFRLNGLYDPNYSGVGHQPMGYDQLTPLYQRYLVRGVKVIVTGKGTTGANSDSVVLAIQGRPINSLTSYPTSPSMALEDRMTSVVPIDNDKSFKFARYFDIAKMWGTSRNHLEGEQDFSSSNNTNPQKECYLSIGVGSHSGLASRFIGSIKLIYYVTWYSPASVATS